MRDRTLEEMREHLTAACPEADEFDRESAIYWFAAHYHGGQGSALYEALSRSEYRPGMMERDGSDENECWLALLGEYYRE